MNRLAVAVIDDDQSILKGFKRLLDACDFRTSIFSSCEAFLESGAQADVGCIVLDIHLGGISGIEMRRRLKAAGSKIPVIFVTGKDTDAVRQEAMDVGCAAYLAKPVAGQLLVETIRKATSLH